PTNSDMIRWLGPILWKKAVKYPFRKKAVDHWRIGIRQGAKPLFDADSDLAGFRWIEPSKGHFWADPFGIEHQGKYWVFFEEYSYAESRGWISCAEISPDGTLISPARCLDNPDHHYSYPLVFRSGTQLFMIPEAFDSGSVDLYRCERGIPAPLDKTNDSFGGQVRGYNRLAGSGTLVANDNECGARPACRLFTSFLFGISRRFMAFSPCQSNLD